MSDVQQAPVWSRMRARVSVVILAATALTACGSTSSGTTTTAPPTTTTASTTTTSVSTTTTSTTAALTVQAAAGIYVAAANKGNAALKAFGNAANNWPSSETGAQAEQAAQPTIVALKQFTTTLTDTQWPSGAVADAHSLASEIGSIVGDLESLSSVNIFSTSNWVQQFTHDAQTSATDANLLRHDLGLPPAAG